MLSLQLSSAVEPAAGQPPRPSRPPPNQAASVGASGPETDDSSGDGERTTPSPGGGPGGESFVSFFLHHWPHGQWYPKPQQKSSFLYLWVPRGDGGLWTSQTWVTLTLLSRQWAAVGGSRGRSIALLTHTLCRNAGKCVTHADPASDRQRDARAGSLRSPSLPHRGYVGGFVGVTSTVLGGLASASQPVSLAPPYHQTRLCDSVRPATSQVSRRPLHRSEDSGCPHLASKGLERRLSPSTLKVYVAAIAAYHDPVEGKSVGKHDWVVRFLRGARRLNLPRPPSIPSWDLSLVLRALQQGPFEPLQTVEPKFLSMKTLLLLALASIKRVGDLHAFSVDDSCLQFGPADSQIILRPRPGYVPKVPTTPFRDQVVSLQALPPEEADPALALLCPVRALRHYVDRTQSFRTSDQLFVCHRGRQKGNVVSKQRMAHWIVDAITLAYQAQGVPCPFRLRAHSTRSVASFWALARGASLTDICRAAGWATPNTFARFYSFRVEPVSSCVLTSNG